MQAAAMRQVWGYCSWAKKMPFMWGVVMNIDEIVRGQLVRVVSKPDVVGQVRQVSSKGNVGIMVSGSIRWVKPDDLEPLHE